VEKVSPAPAARPPNDPAIERRIVVLPEPLGPMIATFSRGATARSTPSMKLEVVALMPTSSGSVASTSSALSSIRAGAYGPRQSCRAVG
jgi:hypothetical protein